MADIHNYKVGETVYVINRTIQGEFFLEGKAKIKRLLPNEDRYAVQFLTSDGKFAKQVHERFVDPAAQDEPWDFLRQLNDR